jgi:hypothetical protein
VLKLQAEMPSDAGDKLQALPSLIQTANMLDHQMLQMKDAQERVAELKDMADTEKVINISIFLPRHRLI